MCAKAVYPDGGFYFQVKLGTETYSFKEVSGISFEIITDEITEGGENRFKYKLPIGTKYNNLELKRGIVAKNSNLMTWINNTFIQGFSKPIKPKKLEVSLLNKEGNVILKWDFIGACPIEWNSAALNSMDNEILIETITFSYNYFTRK